MEDLEPDPWGVDEDVSDDFAPTEKDLRIRDLEEKVNALAHLVESTKGGAEGVRTKAFESKPHRLFESYFECVHANIIEVHNKRARHVVGPECRAEVRARTRSGSRMFARTPGSWRRAGVGIRAPRTTSSSRRIRTTIRFRFVRTRAARQSPAVTSASFAPASSPASA